jgi:hypothetical protein
VIELLNQYIYILLNPFKVHDEYHFARNEQSLNNDNVIPFGPTGVEVKEEIVEENKTKNFSRVEGITISWLFAALMGMYQMMAINLSLFTYDYFTDSSRFSDLWIDTYKQNTQWIFILFTLFNVVIFPLTVLVYLKFWEVMIRFFAQVFSVKGDHEEMIEQVLSCSLTSHFFLVIPVFGRMAHYTANLLFIFAGLKHNMRLSTLQSIIVLASPMFLTLLVVFLFIFFFFAMFGLL